MMVGAFLLLLAACGWCIYSLGAWVVSMFRSEDDDGNE